MSFSPALPDLTMTEGSSQTIDIRTAWAGVDSYDDIEWDAYSASNKIAVSLIDYVVTITALGSTAGEPNDRVAITIADYTNGDDYTFNVGVTVVVSEERREFLEYGNISFLPLLNLRKGWKMSLVWASFFEPGERDGFTLSDTTGYTRTTPTSIDDTVTYTFTQSSQTVDIRATAGEKTVGHQHVNILTDTTETGERLHVSVLEDDPVFLVPAMSVEIPLQQFGHEMYADFENEDFENLEFRVTSSNDRDIVTTSIGGADGSETLTINSSLHWGYEVVEISVYDVDDLFLFSFDIPVYSQSHTGWRPSDKPFAELGTLAEFYNDDEADLTGVVATELYEDSNYQELQRFEGFITSTRVRGNIVELELVDIINLSSIPREVLTADTGGPFVLLKNKDNTDTMVDWPNA